MASISRIWQFLRWISPLELSSRLRMERFSAMKKQIIAFFAIFCMLKASAQSKLQV